MICKKCPGYDWRFKLIICSGHPCSICKEDYGCIDNMGNSKALPDKGKPYINMPNGDLKVKCYRGFGTTRNCLKHYIKG